MLKEYEKDLKFMHVWCINCTRHQLVKVTKRKSMPAN